MARTGEEFGRSTCRAASLGSPPLRIARGSISLNALVSGLTKFVAFQGSPLDAVEGARQRETEEDGTFPQARIAEGGARGVLQPHNRSCVAFAVTDVHRLEVTNEILVRIDELRSEDLGGDLTLL